MNTLILRDIAGRACAASVLSLLLTGSALADPAAGRAAVVGGALPGGAIISARSIVLTPASGGPATVVPIAADGTFRAEGLKSGHYTLRVTSVSVAKQTQGTSFGEKVQSGLAQAGGALASGAQRAGTPSPNNGMPNRISMTVTVARQAPRTMDVDGMGLDLDIGADGMVSGSASAAP